MIRRLIFVVAALAAVGSAGLAWTHRQLTTVAAASPTRGSSAKEGDLVSAAGRVEPLSGEVTVGADISGKLSEIRFEEGDHVHRGDILAVVANEVFQARVASSRAQLEVREAELQRVMNGSREQERQEALAAVKEAQVVTENTRADWERKRALFDGGNISRSDWERACREYEVAQARYEAARQHHSFIDAGPREEDRAKAEANISLARAQLAEAEAMLEKTFIRSPLDGIVLRKYAKPGEVLSERLDTPIGTVGDASFLRVRVDVDETDIGKLRVGQRAYVTADAFGDRKFWGHVVKIGEALGRKNVRTDEPAERVDTKILETLVQLDGRPSLPAGLRVDSFIMVSPSRLETDTAARQLP